MNLLEERFFVTGATGFVGSCLVRKLAQMGCVVHVLVRPGANRWRLRGLEDSVHVHEGDLKSCEPLRELLCAIQPTVIYHLAVHGAYPFQQNADEIILTNVFGTWNLLKACGELDYKLFVNTGSSSEYGAKPHAMRETDLLEPASYYAVAKCAQTLVCEHTARAEGRPINTFRLFSVYGAYEESTRLIPTVIRRCLEGRDLDMASPDTARDFIYADDVVEAYLQVGQLSLYCGEVFNIGTGIQSTLRNVVRAVIKATGSKVKVHWGALAARSWDTETWVADGSKARRLLKWVPKSSLEAGIQRTVEWFHAHGAEYEIGG